MGLFSGPRRVDAPEDRGIVLPDVWRLAGSTDYASVDPTSGETSLQSVAVRATADLICSLASELPVDVFTKRDGRPVQVSAPKNLDDPGDDGMGREDWVYRFMMSWLLRGNAYGRETAWDRRGRATHIDLHHPDDVSCVVMDGAPQWTVGGKPVQDPSTFVHKRVNPVAGRVLGLSPIALHASTIGVSLATTKFGRQWFEDGAHPSGMLRHDGKITQAEAETAKQRFLASQRGSREPVVMGKAWEYQQIQIAPNESQFLETSGLTEAQCARMFGPGFAEVMGYATGGPMTYQNVVERRQDLLVFSMNRWLRRMERVLSEMVPPQQEVQFNRDALLESTTLQRYQAHALALSNQWKTVNEVRELEDMPPVAWGDEPMTATPAGGGTDGNPAGA